MFKTHAGVEMPSFFERVLKNEYVICIALHGSFAEDTAMCYEYIRRRAKDTSEQKEQNVSPVGKVAGEAHR
jgi:hypothetical protein